MSKKENQANLVLFDFVKKEVTYSNDFSNTIFTNFSRKEKQLLLFLIAGIKNEDLDDKIYNFNPKEIKAMLDFNRKPYKVLSDMIDSIGNKPMYVFTSDKTLEKIYIFDKITYTVNSDSIGISWGKSAINLFKRLTGNFSKYFIENIRNLKSENSIEFYLKAESSLFKGSFYLDVEDIKKIFNINYEKVYDIKRKLLDKSQKDINDNTDISISYKDVKKGRSIIGFTFDVRRKINYTDSLSKKIIKFKKNIHVSRSGLFNKETLEKTIHTLLRTFNDIELEKGFELCYYSIKKDFSSISYLETAIHYALENKKDKEKIDNQIEEAVIIEKEENISLKGKENIKLITEMLDEDLNIKTKSKNNFDEDNFKLFKTLPLDQKALIESKALILFKAENKGQDNFLVLMKKNSPTMYYKTLEKYILETMKENLIEEAEIIQKNTPSIEAPIEKPVKKLEEKTLPKKRGRRKKLDMLDELDKNEEVTKNEKKIISFVKKIYGKEKANEILSVKNEEKTEVFWSYYIELLKFNEEQKKK